MKNAKFSLSFVWLAAAFAAAGPARTAELLTVERAVEIALAANRSLAQAELAVARAEKTLAAARAGYLPTLEVEVQSGHLLEPVAITFEAGDLGQVPGIGPLPAERVEVESESGWLTQTTATLTQPLSQMHEIKLGVGLRAAERDVAGLELERRRHEIARAVRALHFRLAATLGEIAAAKRGLEAARELLRTVENAVASGNALPAERLEAAAQATGAAARLEGLNAAATLEKQRLNELLGRDLETAFEVAPLDPGTRPTAPDLDVLRERAAAARPELRQAFLRVDQAELGLRLEKAGRWPDLGLQVSLSASAGVDFLPDHLAQVGVGLSWRTFDGARRPRIAEKALAVEQARLAAHALETQIALEVGERRRALVDAGRQLDFRHEALAAARERTRVETARKAAATALLRDLLTAQADEAQAEAFFWNALAELRTAHADLELAVGQSLDLP